MVPLTRPGGFPGLRTNNSFGLAVNLESEPDFGHLVPRLPVVPRPALARQTCRYSLVMSALSGIPLFCWPTILGCS
jgi:hypothetical protein